MSTEEDRIRKEIKEGWQRLLDLAWEYSDRFDLIRSCLENPEDEASISQLSDEEKTLRVYVLSGDIPQIQAIAQQGKDIQFGTGEYYIDKEMLCFQNKWRDQQKIFFRVLIDGLLYGIVSQEERPWFSGRLDATTDHQREQFQSLIDGINKHISSKFSETQGQKESQSQSGSTERSRARVEVKGTPELKYSHEVLIEVVLEMIESLKKQEAEQQARFEAAKSKYEEELTDLKKRLEEEALVREEAEKKVEFCIERESVVMAYGRKETEERPLQGRTEVRAENTTKLYEYLEQQRAEAAWGGPLTIEKLRTRLRILIQAFEQD